MKIVLPKIEGTAIVGKRKASPPPKNQGTDDETKVPKEQGADLILVPPRNTLE